MQGGNSELLRKTRQAARGRAPLYQQNRHGEPQRRKPDVIMRPGDPQTLVLRGRRPEFLFERQSQPRPASSVSQTTSEPLDNQEASHQDSYSSNQQYDLRQLYRPPSPRIYLDDSDIDRFSVLPTDLPRHVVTEQMNNARTCIMQAVTNGNPRDAYGPQFAQRILSFATSNPVLLYSVMTASMLFMRTVNDNDQNYPLELHIGMKAVQLLSEQMRHPEAAATEANIWAVTVLGYCESRRELRKGKCPRQSFLKELQSLHVYGRLDVNMAHLQGLMRLLQLYGGIDKIKTPGIAQTMSYADLFESSRHLRRPTTPFVPHTKEYLGIDGRLAISALERQWASSALGTLGSSFRRVWDNPPDPYDALGQLLEVIEHMSDFTIAMENYIEGRFVSRPPAVLTDQRNFVQHSLMSLPTSAELENQEASSAIDITTIDIDIDIDPQYEACRLACVAYSFLVILPLPPIAGLFERVTRALQLSILRMRTQWEDLHWPRPRMELHLWILTIGAVVSIGLPERVWYLAELAPLMSRLGIETYDGMERVLRGFLWHPRTHGRDGLDVCRDALQLRRS